MLGPFFSEALSNPESRYRAKKNSLCQSDSAMLSWAIQSLFTHRTKHEAFTLTQPDPTELQQWEMPQLLGKYQAMLSSN